jgi:hypothetical protein
MGAIRSRPIKKGNTRWLNEDVVCDAHRWLRFDPKLSRVMQLGATPLALQQPVFRRWISDGDFLSRLETGWSIALARHPQSWTESRTKSLLKIFLDQSVELNGLGSTKTIPLYRLPSEAQKAYRISSSVHGTTKAPAVTECVRIGPVLLYVELGPDELPSLPAGIAQVDMPDADFAAVCGMYFGQLRHAGLDISCCVVRRTVPATFAGEGVFRNLRLNILRMHAECHGLDFLYRWQRSGRLSDTAVTDTEKVTRHVEMLLTILRPDRGAQADPLGFRLARFAIDQITGERINALLYDFTLNFENPSERMLRAWRSLYPNHPPPNIVMNQNKNSIVNHGAGTTISVAQGAGNTGNVTASIQSVPDSQDFKTAAAEFEKALAAVAAKLEPRQVVRMEDKLADLKKKGEDPAWYTVTAKGLLEAANAVKDIAAPVATTALSVAKLFGVG